MRPEVLKALLDEEALANKQQIKPPAPAPVAPRQISAPESAALGAAQGISLGFADELEAALKAMKSAPEMITGMTLDPYRKQLADVRGQYAEAARVNPKSFLAGQVGGSIPLAFVPGAATAKGLLAMGGIGGLGASQADLTKGEILPAAQDTAMGVTMAGAIPLAGKAVSAVIPTSVKELATKLSDIASERAYKATGPLRAQVRAVTKTKQLGKIGKDLLDEGIVTPGASADTILERASAKMDEYGPQISNSLSAMDDLAQKVSANPYGKKVADTMIDGTRVINDLTQKVLNPLESDFTTKRSVAPEIKNMIDDIAEKWAGKKIPLVEAENIKRMFQNAVNMEARNPTGKQEALNSIRSHFQKLVENQFDKQSKAVGEIADKFSPEVADQVKSLSGLFKTAKSKYGSFEDAVSNITEQKNRELANRFISPSDYGVGLALGGYEMATEKDPLKAAAFAMGGSAANKLARTYGNQIAASLASKASNALQSIPAIPGYSQIPAGALPQGLGRAIVNNRQRK
jgi:hypothetical protein